MDASFYKTTGMSLIASSLLAIVSMVLHPSGGSIEHILKITTSIQLTHSLAISCLPFMLFGFYGLTYKLLGQRRLSMLALMIVFFGLIAALIAALINGLALPYFLSQYSGNTEPIISTLSPIVNYNFALNKGFDYIFIVSLCVAIGLYSALIIGSNKLPKWIGYLGLILMMLIIIGVVTNFTFTNLLGFRLVVFGITGWMLSSGVALVKLRSL